MLQTEQMAGVWANFAAVSHSEHEFTIDFVRMDGTAPAAGPRDRRRARLDVAALRHPADRRAQAELERVRAEGAAEGGVREQMGQQDPPKITIRDLEDEPLNQDGPATTSTDETPVSDDARETVAAVLTEQLRRAGKLVSLDARLS